MATGRAGDVDPLTEAQWNGAFACRFVPHEATRTEYNLMASRKFHCKLARQSYLPLITTAVVEHYFERLDDVASLRISYEMVLPAPMTAAGGVDAGDVTAPLTTPAPEYYPLGVLVDAILGRREGLGVVTFQFRVTGGAPDNAQVLALPIQQADRGLFLNLHQQQKTVCVSLFGSNSPMMKLAPQLMNQMDDAVRQNDARAFYQPRNVVFQIGLQDVMRSSMASQLFGGDMAMFSIHKDGQHALRAVSTRSLPTLGLVLKACVACFEDLDADTIDNQPADYQKRAAVLLTGVEPSLATPTEFLRDHLACPDFVVHITVVQPADSPRPRGLLPQVDWRSVSKNPSLASPLADGA